MIRVEPPDEPPGFDEEVRERGLKWLEHPAYGKIRRNKPRPLEYWTHWKPCTEKLAEGFHYRCGYSAAYTPVHTGNVDHFVSWVQCKQNDCHALAYEWENFRWLDGRINQIKNGRPSELFIDPFVVEDDWFELDLGRGVLEPTDRVPPELREQVDYTLDTLDLRDGPIVIAQREDALEDYKAGMHWQRIERKHPLVMRAIRRLEVTPDDELTTENRTIKRELCEARRAALERLQQERAAAHSLGKMDTPS